MVRDAFSDSPTSRVNSIIHDTQVIKLHREDHSPFLAVYHCSVLNPS